MTPVRPIDFLILLTLVEGERHGYAMLRDVEALSEGNVVLDAGNLYRSIKRLLEAGLIQRAKRRATPNDDERRQYYRLTVLGKRTAAGEVRRMSSLLSLSATKRLLSEVES